MDFKIDTRDTFTVISPVTELISVNLSDELRDAIEKMRQSGSQNFIVDLADCKEIEDDAIGRLVNMHEESYDIGQSLVFTGVKGRVLTSLRDSESDQVINVAPKMAEAIDIISMEMLERDLYGEEE